MVTLSAPMSVTHTRGTSFEAERIVITCQQKYYNRPST
jgi:hypothetical protein